MDAQSAAYRYAIYLTPAEPWYSLGSLWLGRDAQSGVMLPRSDVVTTADTTAETTSAATLFDWTSAPRHYGLHATLKPPFRLAEGRDVQALDGALRRVASQFKPFSVELQRQRLRGFLAWCLSDDSLAMASTTGASHNDGSGKASGAARLHALADACVAELDEFRAPPTAIDLVRRRNAGLTPDQDRNLQRWGYPYVFDTFTFHITLTDKLDAQALEAAESALLQLVQTDAEFAPLAAACAAMPVEDISLFVQPAPDAPFVIARHYGFDAEVRDGIGAIWLSERS